MNSRVPISLIIDDSGPVNMYFFHDLGREHELLVPVPFLRKFAKVVHRNGIKGKFSMVPCPAGLGRLDGKIHLVPSRLVRDYLGIVKNEIEPVFSITPEILTHYRAYNLEQQRAGLHVFEDELFSTLNAEGIRDYVGLALDILVSAGLNPTGVTSPWACGIDNEDNYARGIGMAFVSHLNRDHCFYFLHCRDHVTTPTLMCNSAQTGRVVSIPANTFDAFWGSDRSTPSVRLARRTIKSNIDTLLSEDGRNGKVRELVEKGLPVTLISHWQSLYSDGRELGLEGLETLVSRINSIFGDSVEWMSFEELANRWKQR